MRRRPSTKQSAVFLVFCLLSPFLLSSVSAEETIQYSISDIEVSLTDSSLTYTIVGNTQPVFTVTKRFAPFRVVLDIAGANFAELATKMSAGLPTNSFVELNISEPADVQPPLMRFEFKLADTHDYKVEKVEN